MRLTRLTLKNWRNFREADFALQERMFVVGANASGKSNLLDALRFLNQIASPGGGFQKAIQSRGGMSRVRCLAARNFNGGRVTLQIGIGDRDPGEWTYELTFTAERRGQHRPVVAKEIVRQNGDVVIDRPNEDDTEDPERLTQTHLEQVNANREFREVVSFLQSIRYLHLVPHMIREPERVQVRSGDPYGSDFLLRIAKTPNRTRERRLGRINSALKAAVPQLDKLEPVQDEAGHWHLKADYEHWRPQPALQDETVFSDGTLRLIGLLWSLLENGKNAGPLLLEEPELSLHASVVRQLPGIFSQLRSKGGAQVFMTTHSRDLLLDEGIGLNETVVLFPGKEGTTAVLANQVLDAEHLLKSGLNLAEIVEHESAPQHVANLWRSLVGA